MIKRIVFAGCSHEGKDARKGYNPLKEAISDYKNEGGFDLFIHLGDHAAGQGEPTDEEGEIAKSQYADLTPEERATVYEVRGNHDRSHAGKPDDGLWWRKYIDPLGEFTSISGVNPRLRPYPITGTWDKYSFQVGNILFLMMSDMNRPTTAGRGIKKDPDGYGGDPGGVVLPETWEWFKEIVLSNQDKIIIVCHHYLPRGTTSATGDYEGCRWNPSKGLYEPWIHGTGADAKHSSRLSYLGDLAAPQVFESFFDANPGCIAMWFGTHSHLKPGPEGVVGGKGLVESRWGITFVNAGALTRYHGVADQLYPGSRMLILEDGQQIGKLRRYFHTTTDFAEKGWWPGTREIDLGKPVQF